VLVDAPNARPDKEQARKSPLCVLAGSRPCRLNSSSTASTTSSTARSRSEQRPFDPAFGLDERFS
jgi:hypothetical protein